uniref:C-type lectin domain-containing protein n=1 Tax=Leptobrachium leishanense TaxID=445787 RepID=A0A8C5QH77_9ANUR
MENIYGNVDVTAPPDEEKQLKRRRATVVLVVLQILLFLFLIALTVCVISFYFTASGEMSGFKNSITNSIQQDFNTSVEIKEMKNYFMEKEQIVSKQLETVMKEKVVLMDKIKKLSNNLASFCMSCPIGWKFIGSSCYFFSAIVKKWEEARDDCDIRNSRLLIIDDKKKSSDLKSHYKKSRYWIGLRSDDKDPAVWKWLDGTNLGFKNWKSGEPNNYGGKEHCGEIVSEGWNDAPCDFATYYICERLSPC